MKQIYLDRAGRFKIAPPNSAGGTALAELDRLMRRQMLDSLCIPSELLTVPPRYYPPASFGRCPQPNCGNLIVSAHGCSFCKNRRRR